MLQKTKVLLICESSALPRPHNI